MKGKFMHPRAAERLTALGAPNNIFTRAAYRAGFATLYIPLYIFVKTAAFVTRKDQMEVLQTTADKLKLDIDVSK
jgi:hypothetical protein